MDIGEVELLADEDRSGGWLLLLDRVRQSYVSLDDPSYIEFPYVQVLADAIETLPAGPLDTLHIGGGGATLARWLATARPGSHQIVFEAHAELLRVVRTRLPVAAETEIEFRLGDGRAGVADQPSGSADVVVIDAFSGGRVPAELSTAEFFADVARVLRPAGILLVNTTAAARSVYLRRFVAAIATVYTDVVMTGEQTADVGNLVIVAATGRLASGARPAGARPDSPMGPSIALSGPALLEFIDGAEPLTDASSMRSPIPPDESWRVGTY